MFQGRLKNFSAVAKADGEDFSTGEISLSADMASLFTNKAQRDAHLRTRDFFEVERFPELHFTSTKGEMLDSNTFTMQGDLTRKGVANPDDLQVEFSGVTKDPWGGERAGFVVTEK